jgi:hypothetical protein
MKKNEIYFDPKSHKLLVSNEGNSSLTYFQKEQLFESIFSFILPNIGSDPAKIVMLQTLITLKIEGLLDDELTDNDIKMAKIIQESVLNDDEKRSQSLRLSQKLLK